MKIKYTLAISGSVNKHNIDEFNRLTTPFITYFIVIRNTTHISMFTCINFANCFKHSVRGEIMSYCTQNVARIICFIF